LIEKKNTQNSQINIGVRQKKILALSHTGYDFQTLEPLWKGK